LVKEEDFRIFYEPHDPKVLKMSLELIAIDKSIPAYKTEWDGFIGLAPIKKSGRNGRSFMEQLKNQGKIDHYVFAMYIRESSKN